MTGVLLFGVDRFRTINDALGHATGDRLLIAIARRLEASVRVVDRVARRGVDEFAVLLENVDACAAERIAARLTRVLGKPFRIDGSDLVVTMSVGIAVATDDPLRDAGIALTRAKALGRARTVAFDPSMRARATRAMTLEQELRAAVDRDSFSLMYQPIVDARSMRIRTFEALLRWGRLMPADFIPLAEETGLIIPIGEWVISRACEWIAELRDPSIKVSVNVTTLQLSDARFPRRVERALKAAGVDPTSLCLEMTESHLLAERETALAVIRDLRDLGVDVDIDDFGMGYSSFDHLCHVGATGLKLDKAFLAARPNHRRRAIVEAMVRVGHLLDMTVTAEGVETADDLDVATSAGCDAVQGFYISHPLSADEALQWSGGLSARRLLTASAG